MRGGRSAVKKVLSDFFDKLGSEPRETGLAAFCFVRFRSEGRRANGTSRTRRAREAGKGVPVLPETARTAVMKTG